MSHIDPERLALFALGEPGISVAEQAHLGSCPGCVDDLAALRHAALAGRATFDIGELEIPPETVWARIATELSLASPEAVPGTNTVAHEAPVRDAAAPAAAERAPAGHPEPTRRRPIRRGWVLAASLVLLAGVGLGSWALVQGARPTEVAAATLAALPDHPGARGTAIVEEGADGTRRLRVELNADATPDTFREVWLLTADASALVSLGVLDDADQTFAIPADVDLGTYSLVDVSLEAIDGDPGHSGDSIVRGELERPPS